jgi:hypothetical protein
VDSAPYFDLSFLFDIFYLINDFLSSSIMPLCKIWLLQKDKIVIVEKDTVFIKYIHHMPFSINYL